MLFCLDTVNEVIAATVRSLGFLILDFLSKRNGSGNFGF